MNITVIYASGRGGRSCSRGIAGMLIDELMKEKEEKEAQLEEKMDRWVYLNDLAEQIEAQKNR